MDLTRIGGKLPGVEQATGLGGGAGATAPDGSSFSDLLKDSIKQVNQLQVEADKSITDLASGGPASLHDTMIALEKAETSFKLMMQVRNKIVDAYHEVLRMQV